MPVTTLNNQLKTCADSCTFASVSNQAGISEEILVLLRRTAMLDYRL
jgi:hypothetical protein